MSFVVFVLAGPVRFPVPAFREIWAEPGPIGFSVFALFALTSILLLHLVALDLLLPLWRRERPGVTRWFSTVAGLVLLGAVGSVLARMADYPLNDLWYRWVQIDEDTYRRWLWIGRVTGVVPTGEPGVRSVTLHVALENGARVEVDVLAEELWGSLHPAWTPFGGVFAEEWVRASAPIETLREGRLVLIQQGSTLFSGRTLWRFSGLLPVDDAQTFVARHCSTAARSSACAESLGAGSASTPSSRPPRPAAPGP